MADLKKIAIKGTTQQHLPIEDVVDNIVLLKDGSCCLILQTPSVNFDLLSEGEQEAMIYAYGALLNSLNFSIQILIRSGLKDVSSYLRLLKEWESKQSSALLNKMIVSYRKFIDELVEKNEVLTKSFYIVIPFSVYELGIQSAKVGLTSVIPFLGNKNKEQNQENLPLAKDVILKRAKASLEPKKEHIIRAFGHLGLRIRQLETKDLIDLFYQIYNEESLGIKEVSLEDINSAVTFAGKNV